MDEINWVRCREPVEFNEWMNDVRSVKRINLNEKITPSLSESSTLRDNNNIAELPCTCMLRNATMNVTCTSPASICPSFKSSILTETGATNVLFHFIHPSIHQWIFASTNRELIVEFERGAIIVSRALSCEQCRE